MIKKMDKVLAASINRRVDESYECLVYVKNFKKALSYFKQNGIIILGEFPFLNAISISVKKKNLRNLVLNQNIKFLSSHSKVFALMNVARKILNVETAGFGVDPTIAYIDTGIFPHIDFSLPEARIIKFVDLINSKQNPYDDNGHGTFVAGVGSGNGLLSGGEFRGVCPQSKIISIKALNAAGEASATKILEAMQWVYDNKNEYNISVVCMSFGSEPLGENDPIMLGANKLWDSGIIVVAAGGNSGPEYKTIKSPGVSRKIITVGGFDDNRFDGDKFAEEFFEIAEFSSRGPAFNRYKPDVVAPAVEIASCGVSESYVRLSGTSVATPMIAALCAIYKAKFENLSPEEIKNILLLNAQPITFNKNKEGSGRAFYI